MSCGSLSVVEAAELKRLLETEVVEPADKFRAWRRRVLVGVLEDYTLGKTNLMLGYDD